MLKRALAILCLLLPPATAYAVHIPKPRIPHKDKTNSVRVQTDKGEVEGAYTADQQVIAFKGIPYAAPPVGDLRWKPPQPAAKWKHILAAKDFGNHCIQSNSYPDMVFHDPGASEDCLTLNVWAPAKAVRGSLPVMVWIYGGGFVSGGTSESRQDGQFLSPPRRHRREHELPPRHLRLLRAP